MTEPQEPFIGEDGKATPVAKRWFPYPEPKPPWQPMPTAPRDGATLVDLWGYDRDPDPKAGGIMLPLKAQRWTDCRWHAPQVMRKGLLVHEEYAWYCFNEGVNRIWPTAWMLPPPPPEDKP